GIWEDSLFVFMGDVGMGERTSVPFDPHGNLDEARLGVPLIVKFPKALGVRGVQRHSVGTSETGEMLASALGIASDLEVHEIAASHFGGVHALVDEPLVARHG